MNTLNKSIIALALGLGAASSFAVTLGNELTERPVAASSKTRAEVQAETRAWMAQGHFERTSYDDLIGVVTDRQIAAMQASPAPVAAARAPSTAN